MKRIRDFIYDYNDILVAVVVIVAAAFIVMWRVDTVMAYPLNNASGEEIKTSEKVDMSGIDLTIQETEDKTVVPEQEDDTEIMESIENFQSGESEDSQSEDAGEIEYVLFSKDEDFKWTWYNVAEELLNMGLIEDKSEFIDAVSSLGLTSNLRKGSYNIPVGSSCEDIVKIFARKSN